MAKLIYIPIILFLLANTLIDIVESQKYDLVNVFIDNNFIGDDHQERVFDCSWKIFFLSEKFNGLLIASMLFLELNGLPKMISFLILLVYSIKFVGEMFDCAHRGTTFGDVYMGVVFFSGCIVVFIYKMRDKWNNLLNK